MADTLDMIYDIVKRTEDRMDSMMEHGCPKAQENQRRLNTRDAKDTAKQSGIVAAAIAVVETARYFIGKQ